MTRTLRRLTAAAALPVFALTLGGCTSYDSSSYSDTSSACATAESMRQQLMTMVLEADEEGRVAVDDPDYLRLKADYADLYEECTGSPIG